MKNKQNQIFSIIQPVYFKSVKNFFYSGSDVLILKILSSIFQWDKLIYTINLYIYFLFIYYCIYFSTLFYIILHIFTFFIYTNTYFYILKNINEITCK